MKKIIAVIDPNAPADIQSVLKDASNKAFDSAQDALSYLNNLNSIEKKVAAIYATENLSDASGIDFMITASSIDEDYEELQTIIVGSETAASVQDVAIKRGVTRWIDNAEDLASDIDATVNDALEASLMDDDIDIESGNIEADDATSLLGAPDELISDDTEEAAEALIDELNFESDDDIFESTDASQAVASTALLDAVIDDDDSLISGISDAGSDDFEQELIDEKEALTIADQSIQESHVEALEEEDSELEIEADSLLSDDETLESDDLLEELTDLSDTQTDSIAEEIIEDESALLAELADLVDTNDDDIESSDNLTQPEETEATAELNEELDESALLDQITESLDDASDEELADSISDEDLASLEQELGDDQSSDEAESSDSNPEEDLAEAELMKEFEALMDSGEFEELAAVVDAEEEASLNIADTDAGAGEAINNATADKDESDEDTEFSYDNIDMEDNSYGNLAALVKEVSGGEEHELDLPDSTTKDIKKMINTRVQDAILDHGTVMLMASKDFTRKYGSQQELLLAKQISRLEQRIAELEAKLK